MKCGLCESGTYCPVHDDAVIRDAYGEPRASQILSAWTFERALGDLRKKMYVYQMNLHKPRVREETKERMRQELVAAAKFLGEWDDPPPS